MRCLGNQSVYYSAMFSSMVLHTLLSALLAAVPAPQSGRDKELAPPPLEVDGLIGIPIDIIDLQATLKLDVKVQTAFATATMVFEMTAEGYPLFDLRQREVVKAWINGESIAPEKLAAHAVSKECGSMRILELSLPAGARHELKLEYKVGTPDSPQAQGVLWREKGVLWDSWYSDLNQGRYLESWFPANLIYDQHPFTLALILENAGEAHHLISNAKVKATGKHGWVLTFPPTFTAFSHLIVLVPESEVETAKDKAKLKSGASVEVEVFARKEAKVNAQEVAAQTAAIIMKFDESVGKWAHTSYCPVYIWTGGRSMEYDGGTTTALGALEHEMFHSWYGRGAKPASQNDGWWDEAWNMYVTGGSRRKPDLTKEGAPVLLSSANPYNRITPGESYGDGAAFFARLAQAIGDETLRALMAEFYLAHAPNPATTAEMESLLRDKSGKSEEVRRLFERYVYGKEAASAPAGG